MAKRNMKAIPVATEAPRPTEPPAEGELGRQALERARRFLKGRESLVAVYGEDWRELARRDLELVDLFGLFDDRVRTRLYLRAYRDALLATSYPDQGLPQSGFRSTPRSNFRSSFRSAPDAKGSDPHLVGPSSTSES